MGHGCYIALKFSIKMLSALLIFFWTAISVVLANTEKIIFITPEIVTNSKLNQLTERIDIPAIYPESGRTHIKLPVDFGTSENPNGCQSWYLLRALEKGRRYEIKLCWAATVSIIAFTLFYLESCS